MQPDALIIQDPTLLHQVDLFKGLRHDGLHPHQLDAQLRRARARRVRRAASSATRLCTLPATEIAIKHVGRPVPNVPLLGGFAAISGQITLESVVAAIREKFPATIAEANVAAADRSLRARDSKATGGRSMLKQIEGSRAVAEAIALCRPQVICAYPITPQTHIVEGAGRDGEGRRRSPTASSSTSSREFAAMSVAIGASAAGARTYTATASQGLLFMAEAVYNAAGLGLPIVMTIGNRAIGAPINIWNDHSDSMSMRDSGWIQLFAETNQEALDLHIQAFRLAEELSCPVMVCMDGFILTHAYERVDMPTQAAGRRVPAAVRAAAGARPGRAGVDRRDGRARRRSPRSATSRTTSSCAR